jgi:hypothetical protein
MIQINTFLWVPSGIVHYFILAMLKNIACILKYCQLILKLPSSVRLIFDPLLALKEDGTLCSMLRGQLQLMIYFRLFIELDLVFQSCQRWSVT